MHVSCWAKKNNNHRNIDNWADILSQAVLVFGPELVFGAEHVSLEQSTCYSFFVDWRSCWMQSRCLELVCLVQSRCLELVFGEELVSGAEWPVLGKSSSLGRGTLVFAAELACGAVYRLFYWVWLQRFHYLGVTASGFLFFVTQEVSLPRWCFDLISWGGLKELSNRLVIWGIILIRSSVFPIPAGLKWKTCYYLKITMTALMLHRQAMAAQD